MNTCARNNSSLIPIQIIITPSFYVPQQYWQVLLRERISYGNSVCLSVTTRYGFKAR